MVFSLKISIIQLMGGGGQNGYHYWRSERFLFNDHQNSCYAFREHWTNDFSKKCILIKMNKWRFVSFIQCMLRIRIRWIRLILNSWIRIQKEKSKEENVRTLLCKINSVTLKEMFMTWIRIRIKISHCFI